MKRLAAIMIGLCSYLTQAYGADGSGQMMINIDNPAFRKLVIAVPKIQVSGAVQSPQGKKLAEEGSQELIRLLQFSGFFAAFSAAFKVSSI